MRITNDPRPALDAVNQGFVYAFLHAHQAAAVICHDEDKLVAMVSRSTDGDLLIPSLRCLGIMASRGSSRKGNQDKGGRQALTEIKNHLRGGVPVAIAVDGPRGPRNFVHRGVAEMGLDTQCPILPVAIICSRKWVLNTWDRMQIPKPFARVEFAYGALIQPADQDSARLREAVAAALRQLEMDNDPQEAARNSI
jgi:lysophospholipid acyltransferase (LPLAT)-like uncharacterized protein